MRSLRSEVTKFNSKLVEELIEMLSERDFGNLRPIQWVVDNVARIERF